MSKKENIKSLYGKVKVKNTAIQLIADDTGKSYGTVKNTWLCNAGGFSVPEKYQDRVIELLQNIIKNQ